jgi:cobalt-zinc-cadmium efflux system membrane fusion protein
MNPSQPDPAGQPSGTESIARRAWSPARQWRLIAAAAAAGVAVVLFLWLGGRFFGGHVAPPAAAAPPPGSFRATDQQFKTLTVETVGTHGFASDEITEGKIAVDGDRATPVFSPYSGRVTRVIAGLGDVVRGGAPLASVEASEFVQAQSDLMGALAQVRLARSNESRRHALFDAKGGSLQDWQQSQADLITAETAVKAVRNRLAILGKSAAEIDALEREEHIDPVATIDAPLAGVVVDRQVGPGQYLQSGSSTPVFTIADPSILWLVANVRETDAGAMRPGLPVDVRVPAYPNRTFKARLTYVAAVVDPVTHRLPVRAEIDNRDGALKAEMSATFRIVTSSAVEAPAVPEIAVVYDGDSTHVWVVADQNLIAFRAIRTGRHDDGLVEVLDGLKPGERIVTKGSIFIDQVAAPAAS